MWHPLEIINPKIRTHGDFTWVFLEYLSKFCFFINWPMEFPHAFTSIPLEILCPQTPCLYFFWNSSFKYSPKTLFYSNLRIEQLKEDSGIASAYGIKKSLCLNDLIYYHVIEGLPSDRTWCFWKFSFRCNFRYFPCFD